MKYSDLISVNENFQYSVNLQFDINNIEKIKNYIPTKDGCDVLKNYVKSIILGKNRSTTLIGPYGKGKSHLLLVLLMIISDYDLKDEKIINDFIDKVRRVDEELYNLLIEIRNKKIRLLPIIVNSNYNDLNQAFLLGLNDALERYGINNIITSNYYTVALETIENWTTNFSEISADMNNCLKNYSYTLKELINGLKKFSNDALMVFNEVYSCITRGQKFNPLVNNDIIKTYKDITYELCKNGFNGIFIAFDEFSKFLESSDSNYIMHDMKILQDFAELADRTGKNEQIHISCITHKGISEYIDQTDSDKINAFKTVEGRFKNIYFNRSMEQNYEIISYALEKHKNFVSFIEKYIEKNALFYMNIKELNSFKNTDNIERILFKGCFPLNPITCFSVIELSEKIAQNERTLFTFITDNDQNGLKKFIDEENAGLFSLDKVFDYFESILKNTNDDEIKQIWLKASNSLKKNISSNSKKIIKALAVILMINNFDELVADDNTISLSLFMGESDYKIAIEELIEKNILRRKKITEELDFASTHSKKITNEIKELVSTQFDDINEKNILSEVIGKWYSLPRRYNEEYKITRFFENIFISENELMNLTSLDYYFENIESDGIIINLIRTSRDLDELINHFKSISNNKAILKISKIAFSKKFLNLLKEYDAIDYLISQSDILDDERDELLIIKNEVENAIKDSFKYYYSNENILEYLYLKKEYRKIQNISTLLSSICESIYNKTPIINNELINKNDLSAPIKKAREIVVETILTKNDDLIKSKTSAEATIYKSIVEKKSLSSIKNILDIIKKFIQSTDNNKKSFVDLYKILESEPYSIRKGIIPILIAMVIGDYYDNIIVYYMNREIEIDSTTLIKINDSPEKFYIVTEEGTNEKFAYIDKLLKIYSVKIKTNDLRSKVSALVDGMKKWVYSLPRIIREADINSQDMIDKKYILVKNDLLRPDLNNNEFIFKSLNEILEFNDYEKIIKELEKMYLIFNNFIDDYSNDLINKTKNIISNNYLGSLGTLLDNWYKNLDTRVKNSVFDMNTKRFLNYISSLNTYDDKEILNNIIRIVCGFYIEDWQINQGDKFLKEFKNMIDKIENITIDDNNLQKIILVSGNDSIEKNFSLSDENISSLGKTMKNNLEDLIDEYGNSISESEKISILISLMKKYM